MNGITVGRVIEKILDLIMSIHDVETAGLRML